MFCRLARFVAPCGRGNNTPRSFWVSMECFRRHWSRPTEQDLDLFELRSRWIDNWLQEEREEEETTACLVLGVPGAGRSRLLSDLADEESSLPNMVAQSYNWDPPEFHCVKQVRGDEHSRAGLCETVALVEAKVDRRIDFVAPCSNILSPHRHGCVPRCLHGFDEDPLLWVVSAVPEPVPLVGALAAALGPAFPAPLLELVEAYTATTRLEQSLCSFDCVLQGRFNRCLPFRMPGQVILILTHLDTDKMITADLAFMQSWVQPPDATMSSYELQPLIESAFKEILKGHLVHHESTLTALCKANSRCRPPDITAMSNCCVATLRVNLDSHFACSYFDFL